MGVFTGCLAYYLYETHPRTARAPGESLRELVKWKTEGGKRIESGEMSGEGRSK